MTYQKKAPQTIRQFNIIKRLYALEPLQGSLIAEEYNVSTRTILRDMQKILQVIPLHKQNGIWSLDTRTLKKDANTFYDVLLSAFAQNIEIEAACLEKSNISSEKVTFAIEYKNLPKILGNFLVETILAEEKCSFTYVKPDSSTKRVVDPIKIYTENGRWYVIARDYKDDKVKYFNLEKIKNFTRLAGEKQTLTPEMIAEASAMKSIWSSTGTEEAMVRLYIHPEIAHYIRDIKLHKSQVICDEHYDGGLEVHCTITHKLEILPQIKYWLPHIYIIEPKWLWEDLMQDLEIYRDEDEKMQYE